MNSLDTFCLNALKASLGAMALTAAAVYLPSRPVAQTKPVVLWKAEACDDWVCTLEQEMLAKPAARPKEGKGYSEQERKRMNKLIVRLHDAR